MSYLLWAQVVSVILLVVIAYQITGMRNSFETALKPAAAPTAPTAQLQLSLQRHSQQHPST